MNQIIWRYFLFQLQRGLDLTRSLMPFEHLANTRGIYYVVIVILEILHKEIRAIPYSHTPWLLRTFVMSLVDSQIHLMKEGGKDEHSQWISLFKATHSFSSMHQLTRNWSFPKETVTPQVLTEGYLRNKTNVWWKKYYQESPKFTWWDRNNRDVMKNSYLLLEEPFAS